MDMRLSLEERQKDFAARFNLTLQEYHHLVHSCNMDEVVIVLELMKAKNPKSSYRKFMQERVRRWLTEERPGKPLTPSEMKMLTPSYAIRWSLPK